MTSEIPSTCQRECYLGRREGKVWKEKEKREREMHHDAAPSPLPSPSIPPREHFADLLYVLPQSYIMCFIALCTRIYHTITTLCRPPYLLKCAPTLHLYVYSA